MWLTDHKTLNGCAMVDWMELWFIEGMLVEDSCEGHFVVTDSVLFSFYSACYDGIFVSFDGCLQITDLFMVDCL